MVGKSPSEDLVKQNIQDLVEIANIDIACELPDPDVHPQGIETFVVSFDKIPHSVEAGQTRIFPRYLADHYAKHLADHILTRQKLSVNDPRERPKIIEEIYKGVKESYAAPRSETEGEVIAKQVTEANVPAPKPEPISTPPVAEAKAEPPKPKRTRKELFAECKELGIETTGYEKVDDLIEKIQVWSGVK
jgi:hypothetical protein